MSKEMDLLVLMNHPAFARSLQEGVDSEIKKAEDLLNKLNVSARLKRSWLDRLADLGFLEKDMARISINSSTYPAGKVVVEKFKEELAKIASKTSNLNSNDRAAIGDLCIVALDEALAAIREEVKKMEEQEAQNARVPARKGRKPKEPKVAVIGGPEKLNRIIDNL